MSDRGGRVIAVFLGLTALVFGQAALAAEITWDGDTSNDLFSPSNWVGDATPANYDIAHFPGGLAVGASTTPTVTIAGMWFSTIIFDAGAPSYTYSGDGLTFELYTPGGDAVINNSSNYQVIDAAGGRLNETGWINAASGDIVVNAPMWTGSGSGTTSLWSGVAGAHNVYFNVDPSVHAGGNLSGGTWNCSVSGNMYSSGRGRFFMDNFAGTVYLGDIGGSYKGTFHVGSNANGALRLTNNRSLGFAANTNFPAVVIWGGNSDNPDPAVAAAASNATLELDGSAAGGGISVKRALMFVDGRAGAARGVGDDPHVLNVSGNNTLTVGADWNTGYVGAGSGSTAGNINIQSDADTLTIAGGPMYNTSPPPKTLVLAGAGNGVIDSQVTSYVPESNPSFPLVKKGTGTWTLTNLNNDYTGTTTIEGGTLLVTAAHNGGGAYTVNAGATLAGVGPITAPVDLSGALSPGNPVGIMTLGGLVVHTNATLVYDLENQDSLTDDLVFSDSLDISSATSISVNVTAVATPPLPDGHYVLVAAGSLVSSGTPTLNYTGPLGPGQTASLTVVPAYKALYLTLGNPANPPPPPPPVPFSRPTWSGLAFGGDNSITNGANWVGGVAPDLSLTSTQNLEFPDIPPGTNNSPMLTADTGARKITFTGTTTAYTFTGPFRLQLNIGGADSVLNQSAATQTFNVGTFAAPGSTIRADGGDLVMNASIDTAGTLAVAGGAHNAYFNVSSAILPGNVPGGPWASIEPVDGAYDEAFYVMGDLTVYMGDLGEMWTGLIILRDNVQVIPTHVNAFAVGGDIAVTPDTQISAAGRTRIESGTAAVKFTSATAGMPGDVLNFVPRSGAAAAAPHVVNVSGDHTYDGFMQNFNTAGTYVSIMVEAGSLKLGGVIQNPQNSLKTFRLVANPGATGEVYDSRPLDSAGGFQCASSTARTWNVEIDGGGTWTNSSAFNNYRGWTWVVPGNTYIFNGTHAPITDYVIPSYEIDGLLRGTGTIRATVILAANGDPTGVIAPGTDAGVGTLTFDGLAVNTGGTFKYRLTTPGSTDADLIVASALDLSTTTAVNVDVTTPGGVLAEGEYTLVDYTTVTAPAGPITVNLTGAAVPPGAQVGLVFDPAQSRLNLKVGVIPGYSGPADFDLDGDVDSADFLAIINCFSGPTVPFRTDIDCTLEDVDLDGDVDLGDFGKWQSCYTGDHFQAAIPDCTPTTIP